MIKVGATEASARAYESVPPPAPNPTKRVIGFSGNTARDGTATEAIAKVLAAKNILKFIIKSLYDSKIYYIIVVLVLLFSLLFIIARPTAMFLVRASAVIN